MNKKVSVIIPAYNEEDNITTVINKTKRDKDVQEIIVVNNLSTDKTEELARQAGAKVINCNMQGKGYAMEEGMKVVQNDIIVFLDADIPEYSENIIYKLTEPIIKNDVDFVKSTFDREGGRVTELVAKPLLKLLFPEFEKFTQPLSGMIAGKKQVFEKLQFEKDYGVDIGILMDVVNMKFNIEEVKIGTIQNKSKEWKALEKMSREVMQAILKRRNIL